MSNFIKVFAFTVMCLLSLVTLVNSQSKYSAGVNKNGPLEDESPFMSNKLNLMWQKAKKGVDKELLPRLFHDFHTQDKLEMELKKNKLDKTFDKDGEIEAQIRNKFRGILKKYSLLDKAVDAFMPDENQVLSSTYDKKILDKTLNLVWKRAVSSGFTEDELDKLKTELGHYEDKVEELDFLRRAIDDTTDDNRVSESRDERRLRRLKKEELEEKYKQLKTEILNFERYSADPNRDTETGGFHDVRVVELWTAAKSSNLSQTDLINLRQELIHFERKISKLKFYEDDLKQKQTESGASNSEAVDHAARKLKDYEKLVKKTHADLSMRYFKKEEL